MAEVATSFAESDVTRQKLRLLKLAARKPGIKSSQIPQVKNPSAVDAYNKRICQFSKQVPKLNCNSITGLKRRAEEVLEEEEGGPKPKRSKMDSAAIPYCQTILGKLMNHKLGNAFFAPVNPGVYYYDIIKRPMDLRTIKQKLQQLKYICVEEFEADVRLTFSNAMLFNPPFHWVHKCAKALVEVFDNHWKPVEMNLEKEHHKDIQLSPSKALRVAQLKTRFAETILNAQRYTLLQQGDKTIGQVEKESAARLNEESEMKRKRQEAREEARMAIRKMERSVINVEDNYKVMKDLEGLMGTSNLVVKCDDRRSLATIWSHVDRRIIRTPLERLGLFIKDDYN
ncbi:transcription factor GTE9-like [Spinacia oleracea]|uniref:Transcription factor GTE9-like n=1 Tax=Spinacia oleracea TaxID=3562 RepID=A0A9R0IA10_SPIOL|nr:transcription factor GTE9-like [Spinacia oleracea]